MSCTNSVDEYLCALKFYQNRTSLENPADEKNVGQCGAIVLKNLLSLAYEKKVSRHCLYVDNLFRYFELLLKQMLKFDQV